MFQNFDAKTKPDNARTRLTALRKLMQEQQLDAFLVPHNDEYQSENLPSANKRLEWLTGFSGSAGFAIILRETAILFVDGRYTLQVRQQTDPALFTYQDLIATPPAVWLDTYIKTQNLPSGKLNIGFDPWLHSIAEAQILRAAVGTRGVLSIVEENLVDKIWDNRPALPCGTVSMQPYALTGQNAEDKLAELRAKAQKIKADACLLTEPDALAWVFNLRGNDLAHTPVALGFALIPVQGKAQIFMEEKKINAESRATLAPMADLLSPAMIAQKIADICKNGGSLMLDRSLTAEAFHLFIKQAGGKIIATENPVALPRAIKTREEINGARAAHLRDGVAMTRFLAWIDREIATKGANCLDEIKAAEKLESLRNQTAQNFGNPLKDISFDTISGVGANGAVIHYRVTHTTNRRFQNGNLYLVDSGGQYRDGTTDITRTVGIGNIGQAEKHCFTLVLKGMIQLTRARFPQGTRGQDLDVLARYPLWQNGLDYAHGTGHGVGSFLNVHEGPQNISRRGSQILYANMIVSNEPGYYREGAFGIRLENLLLICPAKAIKGGDIPMLSFETLTLCPIDCRLILPDLLNAEEKSWLNAYHAHIYKELEAHLDNLDKNWLKTATKPI